MTENDDRQNAALRAEIERLRTLVHQRGIETADVVLESSRRDYRHDRELSAERGRTTQAEERARSATVRAEHAETERADLAATHGALLTNSEFNRQILENSTDCITVLDLDGRLEFMSAGGMRGMEIDDFAPFAMCPWVDFWKGEQQEKARAAVAAAKVGQVGQFERPAPTAKGHMRWWEVIVSPIRGRNGEVEKLLSISRDITVRHEAEAHQRVLFEEMQSHQKHACLDSRRRESELLQHVRHGRGPACDRGAAAGYGQDPRSLDPQQMDQRGYPRCCSRGC